MLIHVALLALSAALGAALKPLEVKGKYFVDAVSGDRYDVVGIAYQPGGSSGYDPSAGKDPLSDKDQCLRDAAIMQILGANAIRVYNLDPDLNHDECASIFNAAGMYMIIDVNSPLPGQSLDSGDPASSYDASYLNRTFAVVEAFKDYPNTLGFFSGNEVISNVGDGAAVPPYVRAVTRDLKNYISKHANRTIPVGYSAADVREILFDSWNYFQCVEDGNQDDPSKADFFALNSYSWCGDATFQSSTYDTLVAGMENTSIPVFYSEYGCNKPAPRIFTEVPVIYSPEMTDVFSGGVVYEYSQETNDYGLVQLYSNGSAQLIGDFYTLQERYASLNFTAVEGAKAPSDSPKAPTCSASLINATTGFTTNFTLPDVPPGAQDIIDNGVTPTPTGSLVDINNYTVTYPVYNLNGTQLTNLAVKPLSDDEINSPGTNTAGSTGTTGGTGGTPTSSTTPSPSKKGAAPGMGSPGGIPVAVIAAAAAFAGALL